MQLYRLSPYSGPQKWCFKDPDTGRIYEAADKLKLIHQIQSYRAQNELVPLQEIGAVIDNYLATLPENRANAEVAPPLRRGFTAYIKGGIALLDFVFYGDKAMVPSSTAEERAAICTSCPQNQFPDKGGFVRWADDLAEACTGGKKTTAHELLGNCMACSCNLRSKVWYKGPFILSAEETAQMPSFCWQLKEFNKSKVTNSK